MIVRSLALRLADLNAIVAIVNDVDVKLYQNDVLPTEDTVLADLTEATFSGYAALDGQQFGAAARNSSGDPQSITPLQTFTHSTGLVDNLVYGYYGVNTGVLQFAERFADGPISMQSTSPPLTFVPKIALPPLAGDAEIIM